MTFIDTIKDFYERKVKRYQNVVQIDGCREAAIISNIEGLPDAVINDRNEELYKRNKMWLRIDARRSWFDAAIRSLYYSNKKIFNYIIKEDDIVLKS